jgi:N utilization substance protein A
MMDLKTFTSAITQIAEEKGISQEKVIETIETAIAAAYKKEYGKRGQIIKAQVNPRTGKVKFWQVKLVVNRDMIYSEEELEELRKKRERGELEKEEEAERDEGAKKVRFNEERHILFEDAKKIKQDVKVGDELVFDLEPKEEFGRIAAQTAKQVILQRIREAERETILSEYREKEGQIISGILQRVERGDVYFDVGKTVAILPKEEQIPGEFYRPGQRMRLYCLSVQDTPKGPSVIVSRAYPKFLSKLFEMEVPEIAAGTVVIKSIAREAGSRSKVAVASEQEGVDPIGAMVGQRGTRVMAVINELGGEKIDIIQYSEKPEEYIANALAPAKTIEVKLMPKNTALVIVPEDQLSLAIGKEGQNVRLAAKLTGWKIDVRISANETEREIVQEYTEEEKRREEPGDELQKEGQDDLEEGGAAARD